MDIIADLILELLGKVTKNIKNARTQTVVDVLVASVCILVVAGYAIWSAVSYYRQGNVWATVAFASVAAIFLLLIGFVILRRIIRKNRHHKRC